MIVRNPKDGKEIETNLSEEVAGQVLARMQSNNFAASLYNQWYNSKSGGRALSPAQYYWFFRLAEQNKPQAQEVVQLFSDLQSFISVVPTMQFKVELDNGTEFGKILLRSSEESIAVFGAYKLCGKIIGDKFYPTRKCWQNLKAQILLFSAAPREWMTTYGKATGYCCVCGRELTNEISVSQGIGPICAGRFGF